MAIAFITIFLSNEQPKSVDVDLSLTGSSISDDDLILMSKADIVSQDEIVRIAPITTTTTIVPPITATSTLPPIITTPTTPATIATTEQTTTSQIEIPTIPDFYYLDVKNILQYPELPAGCEITALAIVLNYLGYDVSKVTLSDDYLDKGEVGSTSYYTAFVGDPKSRYGYGCYSPVILKSATKFLNDNGNLHTANYVANNSFDELLTAVSSGNPVIVWATGKMEEPYLSEEWIVDGVKIRWIAKEHCLVLIGYDIERQTVTFADPMYGLVTYKMDIFKLRYSQLFSQAIVIK